MIIPSLPGFSAGEMPTATKLNAHTVTPFQFWTNKPTAQMFQTSAQSMVSSSSFAQLTGFTSQFDNDGIVDLANNRFVVQTPGLYRLSLQVSFGINATGTRGGGIRVDTTTYPIMPTVGPGNSFCRVTGTTLYRLVAGQVLTLWGLQNSGATISTDTANGGSHMSIEMVAL